MYEQGTNVRSNEQSVRAPMVNLIGTRRADRLEALNGKDALSGFGGITGDMLES